MPTELEIGTSPAPGGLTESANPSPPATSTAPSYSAPPTMSTAPPASTAPTFNSSPPADSPQPTASADAPPLEVPDLPPLPTIPPARDTSATAEASPPVEASPPAPASPPVEASPSAEMTPPVVAAPPAETAAPADMTSVASGAQAQSSLLSTTRLAVQAALDRGELSQALLLLSDWYGDPSLSPAETLEVNVLLSQLAGSVIYSTQHRLEPPYMVQAGEQLSDIAQKCNVPWQLLAKINGLSGPEQIQPGQQLKVVRGPFSALIDLSERRMTLMLDRRYAGQFPLEVDPTISVEEGAWTINQKLLTPGGVSPMSFSSASSDQKSLMMTNASGGASQIVILRGANTSTPAATDPAGRVIRLKTKDVDDVYDILSLGSPVTIRR
jgi:LysM repeat protein